MRALKICTLTQLARRKMRLQRDGYAQLPVSNVFWGVHNEELRWRPSRGLLVVPNDRSRRLTTPKGPSLFSAAGHLLVENH